MGFVKKKGKEKEDGGVCWERMGEKEDGRSRRSRE